MTNQEWLSSLSKDELVEIFYKKVKLAFWCKDCLFHHSNDNNCIECIAVWLELEHEEQNDTVEDITEESIND